MSVGRVQLELLGEEEPPSKLRERSPRALREHDAAGDGDWKHAAWPGWRGGIDSISALRSINCMVRASDRKRFSLVCL